MVLEDRRRLEADLFVDASGFRSELLGRALEEPFLDYGRALFCDRYFAEDAESGDITAIRVRGGGGDLYIYRPRGFSPRLAGQS